MLIEYDFNRIGKAAMTAAMTSKEEEVLLKKIMAQNYPQFKLGVTFISGTRHDVMKNLSRSAIGCALQNKVINATSEEIHAVTHASLEAVTGITNHILLDASLKLKMAIVSDGKWVAVALYGDSAVHPLTNHERAGLGIMNL